MHRLILLACSLTTAFAAEHIFSVGIKGGVPLTDVLSNRTFTSVDVVTHTFSDSKNYAIGPMVELNLPFGFSVEADALYRPISLTTETTVVPRPLTRISDTIHSAEFPILGKYRFLHTPIVKPYVEAGPIFRYVAARASYLSNAGFAIGGGIELKLLLIKLSPEIRFSRWGSDAATSFVNAPPSNLNQAEFLIGLSF
jgi:Outer membrane protein beta-barrel domain